MLIKRQENTDCECSIERVCEEIAQPLKRVYLLLRQGRVSSTGLPRLTGN